MGVQAHISLPFFQNDRELLASFVSYAKLRTGVISECLPSPKSPNDSDFCLHHDDVDYPHDTSSLSHVTCHALSGGSEGTWIHAACSCSFHPVFAFALAGMGEQLTKIPSHMLTSLSWVGSEKIAPRHSSSKQGASKRKQILFSLLDALNELTNDEEAFSKGEPPLPLVSSPGLTYRPC